MALFGFSDIKFNSSSSPVKGPLAALEGTQCEPLAQQSCKPVERHTRSAKSHSGLAHAQTSHALTRPHNQGDRQQQQSALASAPPLL